MHRPNRTPLSDKRRIFHTAIKKRYLSGTGRPVEQDALGRVNAQVHELLRLLAGRKGENDVESSEKTKTGPVGTASGVHKDA